MINIEQLNKISYSLFKTDYKYLALDHCKVVVLEEFIMGMINGKVNLLTVENMGMYGIKTQLIALDNQPKGNCTKPDCNCLKMYAALKGIDEHTVKGGYPCIGNNVVETYTNVPNKSVGSQEGQGDKELQEAKGPQGFYCSNCRAEFKDLPEAYCPECMGELFFDITTKPKNYGRL
jgi:hypothetical protein